MKFIILTRKKSFLRTVCVNKVIIHKSISKTFKSEFLRAALIQPRPASCLFVVTLNSWSSWPLLQRLGSQVFAPTTGDAHPWLSVQMKFPVLSSDVQSAPACHFLSTHYSNGRVRKLKEIDIRSALTRSDPKVTMVSILEHVLPCVFGSSFCLLTNFTSLLHVGPEDFILKCLFFKTPPQK